MKPILINDHTPLTQEISATLKRIGMQPLDLRLADIGALKGLEDSHVIIKNLSTSKDLLQASQIERLREKNNTAVLYVADARLVESLHQLNPSEMTTFLLKPFSDEEMKNTLDILSEQQEISRRLGKN